MIKNDYFKTKMKQLSETITKILELNKTQQFQESHEAIGEAFKQLLGLNQELAENLSYTDLMNFVASYESTEGAKLLILAELLKLDGDIFKAEGDVMKAFNISLKSFNIYVNAILKDYDLLDQSKGNIESILNDINEYEIPFESKKLLFQYYEITKKYDKAEDIFYELIEDSNNSEDIVNLGICFYERLLGKTEEELEKGNLPKDEIEETLNSLREI
ncbi:hypothetical protein HMPREF1982_00528 [Clostridiales bacterium oral taxon 876 str. F0540]|nr:hypothetical protein HMPREF1982_00528 [Clostridiales bacterium oral taxon 876 str. F0540]